MPFEIILMQNGFSGIEIACRRCNRMWHHSFVCKTVPAAWLVLDMCPIILPQKFRDFVKQYLA